MSQKHLKHISCESRCKFGGRKCNLKQKWNNDNCQYDCKKQQNIAYAKSSMLEIPTYVLVSSARVAGLANTYKIAHASGFFVSFY